MTFDQLIYFDAAARCGSFTGAARELFASQPTVSASIRDLEHELGVTLFLRGKKGVTLTPEGEYLLKQARKILAISRDMAGYAAHREGGKKSVVRCEAATLFATTVLPGILADAFAQAPEIELSYVEAANRNIVRDVASGMAHIGVIGYHDSAENRLFNEVERRGLTLEWLSAYPFCCYMAAEHPLARRAKLSLADLAPYPVVIHKLSGAPLRDVLVDAGIEVIAVASYAAIPKLLSPMPFVAVVPKLFEGTLLDGSGVVGMGQGFYDDRASYAILKRRDTSPDVERIVGIVRAASFDVL